MGTKTNPGTYDCLGKLADNEPFFVLRGQDMTSPRFVRAWAAAAESLGCPPEKVAEARQVANAMDDWPKKKRPD